MLKKDEFSVYRYRLYAAMAIACIGYLIAIFALNLPTEVMEDRFWKDADPLFHGTLPIMEYPPFALVFMAVPHIFGWTQEWYNVFYVVEVFIFMALGLYFTDRLAEHYGKNRKHAMLAYSVLMVLLLEFVTDRYDIFPAVLTLISFYCFSKKKYAWAFALIAIGMMTKLYPAMLFPIYFLLFAAKGEWKEAWKGTAWFVGVTLLIVVPVYLMEPEMITNFLSYHSDRPLQIESVAASLIYPLSMFGLTSVRITSSEDPGSFGSDNLVGAVPDAIAGPLSYVMVACVILLCLFFAYACRKADEKGTTTLIGCTIVGVMLIFIAVGKVFSSQYLIWIVPHVVFVIMFFTDSFKTPLFRFTAAAFIMTQVNFVYNIGILHGGPNINDFGMIIILVRNILVIAMLYLILKQMYGVYRDSKNNV